MPLDPGVPDQNRHLGSRCESCHLAGSDVTPETARRLTTTQERMCGRCHEGGVEASHPTGFVPERPLPAAFPLDWKGEVTCSTCHDIHEPAPGRLRVAKRGPGFCLSCHDAEFFESMPEAGVSLMASGHLDARSEPMQIGQIDPYSMQCVQCHEDRMSLPGDGIRGTFSASNGTGMRNHPIGAMVRVQVGGREARGGRDGEVLVPGGKVSCLSCHRGYSRQHGAMVTDDPPLCLRCHVDK
jgi:predicted CXXCH cytochrome family protein